MSTTRRLAAIMFTDIQGYTALMQQNEQQAIRARDKHRRIFNSTTEKYGGKVLQYYGDGTLSIFGSAIDAVKCGIEMQLGFRMEPIIPVRIGIHTGDIFFSDEEIVGDSVNVASRIESLAVSGSVFISEKVYDEVKNQESIQAIRLKAFRLKNIEQPVVVYAISNEGLVVPNPEDIIGKTEPEDSSLPGGAEQQQARRGAGSAPFLATKLFIPPPRSKTVARPRLAEHLNEVLHRKLALISAPAGFGKTTLASEWAAGCGLPLAWLSLDERDSDPSRFLGYLIAALQAIKENLGAGALSLLQSPQPPPMESILTALLNEIAAIPNHFVLVLDDYHMADSQAVDQALAFLLEYMPAQMHLVITTREDPHLPLPRLRVRSQLTEIRASGLRFTPAEAAGFLNQAMGLNLPAEAVAALEDRTEGWIAGLQMAALSMQGRADTAGFIQAFTGSHRFILDYLAEEVLHQQPERIRSFLLQTSILDKLCGPLCDAVTGEDDGKEMLEALERGNLFVVHLDDERRWHRYHHLFAEVLRARLTEALPGQAPGLHLRASEWYDGNGLRADAVHHALAAKAFERAAGLIELAWPEMDGQFQSAAWLKWVRALPDELIRLRPVLIMGCAWAFLNDGELEAGQARLREVEHWLEISSGNSQEPVALSAGMAVVDEVQFRSLPASVAIARAYIAQAGGDVAGTVEHARQAFRLLPEDDHVGRGQAAALLGLTQWASGNLDAAHQALSDTMAHFLRAGYLQFAISVTYGLADIRIAQGRLGEAVRTYEHSLQLVAGLPGPAPRGTADLYLGLAGLHRERGELEAAARQLQKSEELGLQAALPDWTWRLCVARAQLQASLGDIDDALSQLDEAQRLYYRNPMPNVRPIAAQRARLLARQARLDEALPWVRQRSLSVDDELSFLGEFEYLAFSTILIALGRSGKPGQFIEEALGLLQRLLEAAEAAGRMGSVIEILIQQALAQEAQGKLSPALETLSRAMSLAEPEGYVRIFADEGRPMARLLSEAAARGLMPKYVSCLQAALQGGEQKREEAPPAPTVASSSQPLIEPLSERELEILRLIDQGLSNQEISERLFLALSTVKGHNRNIFGKLGAERRTEAVARARELGVL